MVVSASSGSNGRDNDPEAGLRDPLLSGLDAPDLARALTGRRTLGPDREDQFADQIAADLTDTLLRPIWLHLAGAGAALVGIGLLWVELGPEVAFSWAGL